MATILYARVSTSDQTTDHQLAQAVGAGFQIDDVITDDGVSGVSVALRDRPQGRRLYDMLRSGDTLVVRWIDRLGRNYADVTETIRHFMARGVVIKTVINGLTFDGATKDPMGKAVRDALIAFMAALGEAQAEATKEAQAAGIAHAKAMGGKYWGRKPSYDMAGIEAVENLKGQGLGTTEIARTVGLSRQAVLRIIADPVEARKAVEVWGR